MQAELTALWARTIGEPPTPEQFALWLELHGDEVVRLGILKVAQKNQQVGGTMSQDHLVRFASKCMIERTERRLEFRRQHEESRRRQEVA